MIFINNYENQQKWDSFVSTQKLGSFLQSWNWSKFQTDLGNKIFRLAIEDEKGELLAVCLLVQDKLSLTQTSFSSPYGPVIKDGLLFDQKKEIFSLLKKEIDKIKTKELVLLFEPKTSDPDLKKIFQELNFVQAKKEIEPKHTLILDINKDENTLLGQMHPKTRYNIRLAEKKGVKINCSKEDLDLKEFFELLKQTAKRQNFSIFNLQYIEKVLKNTNAKVYTAKYNDMTIAAIFVVYFGETATYLYGGSADEYKNLMAPHLLQWTAILDAKKDGYKFYDFWGAAQEGDLSKKEKNWEGLTRFK